MDFLMQFVYLLEMGKFIIKVPNYTNFIDLSKRFLKKLKQFLFFYVTLRQTLDF